MKKLSKRFLKDQKINWVKPGQSVPLGQGMALNRLNKEYKCKKQYRSGWFIYQDRNSEILENGCYYIIERMTRIDGKVKKCLIAFKEEGCCIKGAVIFTPDN